MKTKASIIIAIIVTLSAIGGAMHQWSKRGDSTTSAAMPALGSLTSSQSRKARESSAKDPLAKLSDDEFLLSLKQITILADDERLTRLRKDLGMDISDEAYRKAIAAYGYQIDTDALFKELVKQWNSEDPRAATLWVSRMEKFYPFEITGSLAAWLIKDKAAAMAWAEDRIAAMHEQDPRASLLIDALQKVEFMHQNPTPVSIEKLYKRMAELELFRFKPGNESPWSETRFLEDYWADYEPGAAVKFVAEAELGKRKIFDNSRWQISDVLRDRIGRWAQLDPDAALQWAKETDKDHEWFLAESLLTILPSWQLKHPDKSISDVADLSVMSDKDYEMLIGTVSTNMASVNGKAAMDLAMAQKEPEMQLTTMADIIETWSMKSPVEVEQWIADAPAGDPRDTAMLAYAKTAGTLTDFETTGKLVREIGNPRIKLEATEHIVSIHDDLTIDLQQALELMREIPVIDDDFTWHLFCDVNEEDEPALRAWIDQAVAEGRIKDVSGDPFYKFEDGMRR